ncbi:GNAT family N-acetyltransferase [Nocardioides sp. R-C-SC26]|uniref:GNAT family N-acetyltransferase n=1 Tax=Nocardioides sp. R-C-SC26 TaxID=2870414 RepID=UPI001E326151|nr:GNAT family N-acetyltransferase [Nocardioides sp. R-C-SC26]
MREDVDAVAEVHLTSRAAAPMPPSIHPAADVRSWLAARIEADHVWVAEVAGLVVGYVRFTDTWLDDLYVLPGRARQGVGCALLEVAKAHLPAGFGLWVFEQNEPARAFYARHGLVETEVTDGRDNEEKCPDVRMEWLPAQRRAHR